MGQALQIYANQSVPYEYDYESVTFVSRPKSTYHGLRPLSNSVLIVSSSCQGVLNKQPLFCSLPLEWLGWD